MTNNGKTNIPAQDTAATDASSDDASVLSVQARLARDERGAALRALAGRLAHQMRNPLAAVRAACSSLKSEIDDPDQRETLDLTLKEIDRMLAFVSATVQTIPGETEKPQPIDVAAELGDVIGIISSGYANPVKIELHDTDANRCMLPRDGFRVSVYSLLEHLIGVATVTGIAVHAIGTDDRVVISFIVSGALSGDAALSNGMVAPVNGFQPVGLLVAERFARDLGGRLSRSDDGSNTQTFSLELPCTYV